MRALTWNLYHGRSPRPAGRSLLNEFAAALAGWSWDVALLQEVPPWWPASLAVAAEANARWVLTSRNAALAARRAIAARNPDVLKANGGGSNAILVRGAVTAHRAVRLAWWPERRWAHGVLVEGLWVVNVHASTGRLARRDALRALAGPWGSPLLFGGDVNLRSPELADVRHVGGNHVDHFFTHCRPARRVEVLERGRLSDHPPVRVTL